MGNIQNAIDSFNPIKKIFFMMSFISSILPIIFILYHYVYTIFFGLAVGILSLILTIIYLINYSNSPNNWKFNEILLLIILFIMILHMPLHFLATSRIAISKNLKDEQLLKLDNILLGWIFTNGQLSLSLDKNNYIGPHTIIGNFINNILQIFYFTYYVIPYVTMYAIYFSNCVKETIFRFNHEGKKSKTYNKRWNNTFFLFGTYTLTYCFVFGINSIVPASSPRKFLENKFIHKLNFSGLGNYLNKTCKDNNSANSFPSGHVAETICISFAYFGMGKINEGLLILFFSLMIALATLFLRYHYFVDMIAGMFLAFLSFLINYYFGYKRIDKILIKNKEVIKVLNDSSSNSKNELHVKLEEEIKSNNQEKV